MSAPIVVFVTDPRFGLATTIRVIAAAARELGEGRLMVQLRDKTAGDVALFAAARELRVATRDAGALLVVNGSIAVARDVDAEGVHFPSLAARGVDALAARVAEARARLRAGALVTSAAHDDDDVRDAIAAEVTGVLVSPIFASPGKGMARGVAALTSARACVDAARRRAPPSDGTASRGRGVLVYALGGVDATTAASCADAGADGVAVIRALYGDDATRSSLCAVVSASFAT